MPAKFNSKRAQLSLFAAVVLLLVQFTAAEAGNTRGNDTNANSTNALPLSSRTVEVKRGKEVRTMNPYATTIAADGREALANRVIVGFNKGVSDADRASVHQAIAMRGAMSAKSVMKIGYDAELVDVSGAKSLEAAISMYTGDKRVAYAEPDYMAYASATPNDPSFGNQWGMTKIQAPSAWNVTTGSSSVKVAVLDCGIYESGSSTPNGYPGHPDLNGKVVSRRDFSGSSTGPDDYCDHGSHVAGIVSANTNNAAGVAGAGWNVSLMNGKVLNDQGSGSTTAIANGIYWAADNGAKVINMSLGGAGTCSSTYQNAVNYAYNRNVVVVVAAGNNGTTAKQQPASCANVISVASTTETDGKSSFSTYGTWVKVAAPGSNIFSTDYNGGYVNKSGTSMATPIVAGMIGLMWSTGRYTTASSVMSKVYSSSDAISGSGSWWQYGRVNAYRAVS